MFIYCTFAWGIPMFVVFFVLTGQIAKAWIFGLAGGICFASIMTPRFMVTLFLFRKRWLLYGNMDEHLAARNIHRVVYESIAAHVNGLRTKHGGLFLGESILLFVPHKFAFKSPPVSLPVERIRIVKKAPINPWRFFTGGIGRKLYIEMKDGNHYEFGVWDTDGWIDEIERRRGMG